MLAIVINYSVKLWISVCMQRISIHKMIEPYMYVMLVTLISIESVLDRFIDKRESLTNLSDLHCSSRPPHSCSVSSFCRIIVQDDVVIIDHWLQRTNLSLWHMLWFIVVELCCSLLQWWIAWIIFFRNGKFAIRPWGTCLYTKNYQVLKTCSMRDGLVAQW